MRKQERAYNHKDSYIGLKPLPPPGPERETELMRRLLAKLYPTPAQAFGPGIKPLKPTPFPWGYKSPREQSGEPKDQERARAYDLLQITTGDPENYKDEAAELLKALNVLWGAK